MSLNPQPFWTAFLSSILLLAASVSAQPEKPEPPRDPSLATTVQTRNLSVLVHQHTGKHGGKLPASMNELLDALAAADPSAPRARAASQLISPVHEGAIAVPETITPEWVNQGTSYVYLGNADVALDDVQEWGAIAIAHLRLDGGIPIEPSPQNPDGRLISVAFLDGHAEIMPRADAERIISNSIQTLEALRAGGDPPPDRHMVQSLGTIARAIRAYAEAHDGYLPEHLGETLEFIPSTRFVTTPAQKARVFLTPAAAKNTHIPEQPTADWVRERCGFVYLGNPAVRLADIPEPSTLVLVHAKADDGVDFTGLDGKKARSIPFATAGGWASCEGQDYVTWICAESRKALEALAAGSDLPDWLDASRDVRTLGDAVIAYAKANDGKLPPDLPSIFDFIPARTPRDRAAAYLSPRAQRSETIPESPDADWLVRHCSYTYAGISTLTLAQLRERGERVLIHARPDESYAVRERWGPQQVVPFFTSFGQVARWSKDQLAEFMARTAKESPEPQEQPR